MRCTLQKYRKKLLTPHDKTRTRIENTSHNYTVTTKHRTIYQTTTQTPHPQHTKDKTYLPLQWHKPNVAKLLPNLL